MPDASFSRCLDGCPIFLISIRLRKFTSAKFEGLSERDKFKGSGVYQAGCVARPVVVAAAIGQFAVIQAAAPSLRVEVSALNVHDTSEIESVVAAFARGTSGGLIVTASVLVLRGRDLVIGTAAKHKLPAVYYG